MRSGYLKIYLKSEYATCQDERKRLGKAIKKKVKQPGLNFTLPELIDSLNIKLRTDRLVYGHYWHFGNSLLNRFQREASVTRIKEGRAYRYFTIDTHAPNH